MPIYKIKEQKKEDWLFSTFSKIKGGNFEIEMMAFS